MKTFPLLVASIVAAAVRMASAQTAVPTAPPTNSFFSAAPPSVEPAPTPSAPLASAARKCPLVIVKGGSIMNAVGIPTTTGCDWSGTIRFKPGDATLAFVSASKVSVRQINLGIDPKGHFGGGIIAMKPNGDVEFVHARTIVNEVSVAFDVAP